MAVICFGTVRGYLLGIRNHLKLQMWGWIWGIKLAAKNEYPMKLRGDGDTNAAANIRTVKVLLLNGAIKPADWANNVPSPLDTRYGAGVLNVFNSYKQLAGGKYGYIVSTSVATNSPHPPTGDTGTVSVLSGWDFNTNSSSLTTDGVNHYYFNVTNGVNSPTFTATITLVWNRHHSQISINNLDLFLYNATLLSG